MPFDSNGNYTLPTSYFVENGDTVLPIQHNPPFEDVAQALSATLLRDGRSPMTGDLKMGTKKITFLGDGTATTDAVTKGQLDGLVSDLWAMQPIGALIATSPWAFTPPVRITPKYRYIQLTAGLTGSGQYNEGALGTESVSGSSPNISATATIILTGSPLVGAAIRLINTEQRFLRAGGPGTLQDSQNLSHAHGVTDPGHSHALTQNPLKGPYNGVNQDVGGGAGGSNVGVVTDNRLTNISIQGSGGDEARPRNMSVVYYMRIL